MRIFRHRFDKDIKATVITVGNFDGLHRGHQLVLDRLVQEAGDRELFPLVYTFFPHPAQLLRGEAPPLLMPLSSRLRGLSYWNLGGVVVRRFNADLAKREAEDFLAYELMDKYHALLLVVGAGHGLGRGRRGNTDELSKIARRLDLEIIVIPTLSYKGMSISSSELRRRVIAGDMRTAREFLGRPFSLQGKVVSGRGVGRDQLAVPTANVAVNAGIVIPLGVFAGYCRGPFGMREAVVNIGTSPTFNGMNTTIEVHILDFEGDLYGQRISLDLLAKLREEIRFTQPEQLKEQIERDISQAQAIMNREAKTVKQGMEL